MTGFEPATPSSRTKCATKLRYIPKLEISPYPIMSPQSTTMADSIEDKDFLQISEYGS